MLTGRESLIRLVGKRRRNLSAQSSLSLQTSSTIPPKADDAGISVPEGGPSEGTPSNLDVDWVTCPVCGNPIRGADDMVNSHLDVCLARGRKRKLAQCTLLQFSFTSGPNNKKSLEGSNKIEADERQMTCEDQFKPSTIDELPHFGGSGHNLEKPDLVCFSQAKIETSSHILGLNFDHEGLINCKDVDPAIKLQISSGGAGISLKKIETYIVGRKFSDAVELKLGASICVERDPENVKDPNTIKVLYMEHGCRQMLGFLPRELAKYLSPLIEKYYLRFEGSVLSLPECSLDVVPIQLNCEEATQYVEMGESDHQVFESLWDNVVQVVKASKRFPLNMPKFQQNFCFLIQEVLKSHAHVFTDDETLFLESFNSLSDDSQRLFIRLYARKGPWFRMSSVSYPEISNSQQAVEALCVSGYLNSFGFSNLPATSEIKTVLNVLTALELREISKRTLLKLQKSIQCTRKSDLTEWLSTAYENGTWYIKYSASGFHCDFLKIAKHVSFLILVLLHNETWTPSPMLPRMIFDRTGACVQVSLMAESLLWRVQRLFFLNGEQDLSAFLLADLGLIKYPSYTCNVSHPIFADRDDLISYEQAIEVAQIMDESLDSNDTEMVIRCIDISDSHISRLTHEPLGTFLSRFSASWVHSKVVTLGISFFERERRYKDAVRLLRLLLSRFTSDSKRGYWTLRLSVDLEHMGHLNESLVVAEEGVLDLWVRAGSKVGLQRRVLRLAKPPRRWKKPVFAEYVNRKIKEVYVRGRPLNCDMGMKSRFYGEDGELCGVEQLALGYYAGEGGWKGLHTESGIWITIFCLLMWDIIFADVPDVFQTKFQTAPLDLYTDSFYTSRQTLIESHLEKIYKGMAEETLIISWESHVGTACQGVNWDRHSLDDLRAIVSCISGPCLVSLCRHLAQDYRSWSSGMPDLLLWRFLGENQRGEVKLVEVKGPRDRLSEQQRACLLLLMDCGFDSEVCKVSPNLPNE